MDSCTHFVSYTSEMADPTRTWNWSEENRRDLARLAEAIAHGTVVSYVGAGPSIAAGLAGWSELCQELYEWATAGRQWPEEERQFLQKLIQTENYPLFVQIIENHYQDNPQLLLEKLKQMFKRRGVRPSEAHRAIAMLPIPLRLTTNYEELLEEAIADLPEAYLPNAPKGDPLTWQDGARLLQLVRSREPGLIKIHGDFSRADSIILTKSHYRRLAHESAFWSVLKALISTHAFLFIGCSLRDPDLFSLLDEVIEECRLLKEAGLTNALPMHYALLPRHSANPAFVRHLRCDYQIATLPVPDGANGEPDLPALLRLISGEVARGMGVDDSLKNDTRPRNHALKARLGEIVRLTGSHRADVVLADGDTTHQLKWWLNWDKGSAPETSTWQKKPPSPTGVITSAFTEAVELLYVRDTSPQEAGVPYKAQDPQVRCELAIPIRARGYRIGVINVESYLSDAYNTGHVEFLQRQAEWIGAAHLDAEERNQRIAGLNLSAPGGADFVDTLRRTYPGAEELRGVIYTADYVAGKLVGFYYPKKSQVEHKVYGPPSFATRVFREGFAYEANVERARDRISLPNAHKVGLHSGPLFGTPVFERGLACAVLVLWANQERGEAAFERCGLHDSGRRLLLATTANLIVASRSWGRKKLDRVVPRIGAIGGETEDEIYSRIAEAVNALGLRRLRVWQLRRADSLVEVVNAAPASHSKVRGAKETWIADAATAVYSPYCALVVGRYRTDPWARVQGANMFDLGPDPLAEDLQKPGDAAWVVAPLVATTENGEELMGYLAADNVPRKSQFNSEPERNWLQCGMSAIAVASAGALVQLPSWNPNLAKTSAAVAAG